MASLVEALLPFFGIAGGILGFGAYIRVGAYKRSDIVVELERLRYVSLGKVDFCVAALDELEPLVSFVFSSGLPNSTMHQHYIDWITAQRTRLANHKAAIEKQAAAKNYWLLSRIQTSILVVIRSHAELEAMERTIAETRSRFLAEQSFARQQTC